MRFLTAVDVDDGACSVIGDVDEGWFGPGRPSVGVIDCGSGTGSHKDAASRLADALNDKGPFLDSIVVSHYDTDHWEGLTNLSKFARLRLPFLNTYVPHMPSRLPAGVLAFLTTRSSDGTVMSLLRDGLISLLRPGAVPRIIPLAQGDTVVVGGVEMDVLWPPEHLQGLNLRAVNNAIKAVEDLADELVRKGSPGLKRAFTALTEGDLDTYWEIDDADRPVEDGQTEEPVVGSARNDARTEEPSEGSDYGGHVLHGLNPDSAAERVAIEKKVKNVFSRIRDMNNDLSLILLAKDNSALFLGDAGGRVIDHVLHRPEVQWRLADLDVMLAPHHGSQPLPKNGLPRAKLCIAQAGKHHKGRWRTNHLGYHRNSGCVCLHGLERITVNW